MSENCDTIVIFSIYGQIPDLKKLYFINSNFLSYKDWKQN